jgi:ribosomal protein S18 acetylase RimI-like enzyme
MIKRGVDDVPDAPTPPGIEIRAAAGPEIRTILAAEDEAFRDHPGHRDWTEGDTANVLESPYYDPGLWRVAWAGEDVAGVVETWVYRDENERLGYSRGWLNRVSVRRPWRKRGLARALIAASFEALRERGIADACLGVDAHNPSGALRLYESMGFEQMLSGRMYVRDAPR